MLTEPRHLIIRSQGEPQVIRVNIPHHLVMAILHNGLNLNQLWQVSPQTYPVNGIISQFEIHDLPHNTQDHKDRLFSIIGTVVFRHENKLKVLTDNDTRIVLQGHFPERYKVGDTLYIKAKFHNRRLHLLKCCSDLEYAIKSNDKRLFSFTLNSYPQFLPFLAERGTKQFWAPHGSEKIAVILHSKQIKELELLKSNQYIAHISGRIENISGVITLSNPIIKTEVKLFEDEDHLFSNKQEDSPRARLLGTELTYQEPEH